MAAIIAAKEAVAADLEPGKVYFWCACGHSKTQPFCDGSHKEANSGITNPGGRFKPIRLSVEFPQKVWLCMCKHSKNGPYCDGTHNNL